MLFQIALQSDCRRTDYVWHKVQVIKFVSLNALYKAEVPTNFERFPPLVNHYPRSLRVITDTVSALLFPFLLQELPPSLISLQQQQGWRPIWFWSCPRLYKRKRLQGTFLLVFRRLRRQGLPSHPQEIKVSFTIFRYGNYPSWRRRETFSPGLDSWWPSLPLLLISVVHAVKSMYYLVPMGVEDVLGSRPLPRYYSMLFSVTERSWAVCMGWSLFIHRI